MPEESDVLILPHKDVTLLRWKKVDELVKPLKKYGITFINYFKITKEGKIADLNNCPQLTEYFYYKSTLYQQFIPLTNLLAKDDGFVINNDITYENYFDIMRNQFNIYNIIFFVVKKKDHTIFWHFGSESSNKNIINFYLNNTELFKKYISYFEKIAIDLIIDCEKNPYILSLDDYKIDNIFNDTVESTPPIQTAEQLFSADMQTSGNPTCREIECLKLCALGKSAEEIGIIFNISKRTVQAHLQNLKAKWKCNKAAQLIAKASEMGFL